MDQASASSSRNAVVDSTADVDDVQRNKRAKTSNNKPQHKQRLRRKKRVSSALSASKADTDRQEEGRAPTASRAFDTIFAAEDGDNATGGQGYYNEYDGSQDRGDGGSMLSHVSLDQAPTYGRLVVAHIFSLLPCLALLLATFMLAWHAPCHVKPHPDDRAAERKACRRVLSDRVSISAFGVGVVCWLAAYALRPALWKLMETGISLNRGSASEDEQETNSSGATHLDDGDVQTQDSGPRPLPARLANLARNFVQIAATLQFVLLKTIALEMLRLFSVLMTNALVIAGLVRTPYWHSDCNTNAPVIAIVEKFHLHWYDPRFTVGVWLAIGWALTEFVVTSWQMFDRLSLYASDFEPVALPDDVETASMRQARDYGATWSPAQPVSEQRLSVAARYQHLSDSDGAGDYSDSAATVRGPQAARENALVESSASNTNDAAASGQQALSSTAQLVSAHQRTRAAAEESGFSISPSEFLTQQQREVHKEDERDAAQWSALREKLDAEMDSLQKARSRVELEQTFGQPLTTVPIVLCTIWRIDGWLWNLGSTLLMSASVTLAQGPLVEGSHTAAPQLFPPVAASQATLFALILLHWLFTSMWTLALPRLGFAAVTYTSMLVGAGLCLAASARWGLLV